MSARTRQSHWDPETALPWLRRCLPQPVREQVVHNGFVLFAGEPEAVVLRLNGAALRIGVFATLPWGDKPALADQGIAALTRVMLPADEQVCMEVVGKLAQAAARLHADRVASNREAPAR